MKELSHEEYLAFLLLYAATADTELNRNEVNRILDCIDSDVFLAIKKYFFSLSNKKRLETILDQKDQYLGNQHQIDLTLNELKNIFLCDNKMLPIEQLCYSFLKKELNDKD